MIQQRKLAGSDKSKVFAETDKTKDQTQHEKAKTHYLVVTANLNKSHISGVYENARTRPKYMKSYDLKDGLVTINFNRPRRKW